MKTKRPTTSPSKALATRVVSRPQAAKQTARTRAALLEAIQSEHDRLVGHLAGLTDEQMGQAGVVGDWSVKDILAHLAAWETRLIQRVQGEPERGTDIGTPAFNELIYDENRNRSLNDVRSEFENSYANILVLTKRLDNRQATRWWTAYAFNTHGHYRWANRHIRQWAKKAH